MDRASIEQYAAGAPVPAQALRGLTEADLSTFPVPGTWSIRQILVHLYDSDLVGSDRMKRVIAMDNPDLLAYDQDAFVRSLHYDKIDLPLACDVFAKNRLLTAAVLRALPDETFARAGMHSERGRETLEDLVRGYVRHLDGHMKHLREKRRLLGKPME